MKLSKLTYPYNLLHDVFASNPIEEYPVDIIGSVEYALSLMSERDRMAIHMRYMESMTLREIGESFEVTSERARQIVNKAVFRLRRPNLNKYLRYGVVGVTANAVKMALDKQAAQYHIENKAAEEAAYRDVTLKELDLSTRAYNCLFRANCRTASDVVKLGYNGLKGLRCLGKKTYEEIINSLESRGFDCFNLRG